MASDSSPNTLKGPVARTILANSSLSAVAEGLNPFFVMPSEDGQCSSATASWRARRAAAEVRSVGIESEK